MLPNGLPYANTDEDWEWVQDALTDARWLGFLSFDALSDQRNTPPTIVEPGGGVFVEIGDAPGYTVPDVDDLLPCVTVYCDPKAVALKSQP